MLKVNPIGSLSGYFTSSDTLEYSGLLTDKYLRMLNIWKRFVVKHSNTWVSILVIPKNMNNMVNFSCKYDILTI